jgi:gluconate 2-dehydrogenase subunit 3-like protein
MKRRSLLQSIVAIPAVAAVAVPETPQQAVFNAETPIVPVVPPVETSQSVRRTFTPDQFYALTQLGDLIVPAYNGLPGASDAGAVAFLDFYVGASPQPVQDTYRQGLDTLNRTSQSKFGQTFANLSLQQAATLLAPLQDPNSSDEMAPFLRTVKSDLLRATFNSRPYIDAVSQTRRPRNASKYFWYPIT